MAKSFSFEDIQDPRLQAIAAEESAKGTQLLNDKAGPNEAGGHAAGMFGMRPSTFADTVKSNPKLAKDPVLGPLADGFQKGKSNEPIWSFLSDPANQKYAHITAKQLMRNIEKTEPDSTARQIYSWNRGSVPANMSDADVQNLPYVKSTLSKMPGGELNQNSISPISVGSKTPKPAVNKADDGEYSALLQRYPGTEAEKYIVAGHDAGISAESTEHQMLRNAFKAHLAGHGKAVESALGVSVDQYAPALRRLNEMKEARAVQAGKSPDIDTSGNNIGDMLDTFKQSIDNVNRYNPFANGASKDPSGLSSILQAAGQGANDTGLAKVISNLSGGTAKALGGSAATQAFAKRAVAAQGAMDPYLSPEEQAASDAKYGAPGSTSDAITNLAMQFGPLLGAGMMHSGIEHITPPSFEGFKPGDMGGFGGNGPDYTPAPIDPEVATAQKVAQWKSPRDLANMYDAPNWPKQTELGPSIRPEDDYPRKYPSTNGTSFDPETAPKNQESATEPSETSPATDAAPSGIVERIKKAAAKSESAPVVSNKLVPEINLKDFQRKLSFVNNESHLANLERKYGDQISRFSPEDQATIKAHTDALRAGFKAPKSVGAASAGFTSDANPVSDYGRIHEGPGTLFDPEQFGGNEKEGQASGSDIPADKLGEEPTVGGNRPAGKNYGNMGDEARARLDQQFNDPNPARTPSESDSIVDRFRRANQEAGAMVVQPDKPAFEGRYPGDANTNIISRSNARIDSDARQFRTQMDAVRSAARLASDNGGAFNPPERQVFDPKMAASVQEKAASQESAPIKKSENDSGTLYSNGGPELLRAVKKANFSKLFPERLNKILNTGEANKIKDVLTNNFRGSLSQIADSIKAMDQQYRAQGMGPVERLKALQPEFLKMHKNALTKLEEGFVNAGMPREEASAWANIQKDFAASTDATTGLLRKWINLKKIGNITTSPAAFLGELGAEVYSHAMGGYSPLKLPEAQGRLSKWMGGGSDAALEYGQKAGLLQGEMHNVTSYDPTLTKNLREIRREGGGVKSAWGSVINGMGHVKDAGFNAYDHMLDVSRTNAFLQEIPKNFDSLNDAQKTKAAEDAVFTVDKFFQNYNRSAGGRIGKAMGLESTAAKALINPAFKFPLEMARITKNAAIERPAFALGTLATMLMAQQYGVAKAKANGIKLTPAQETSFIAPFGKKAIEYNYHVPFLGMFAGYNKDTGKSAAENGKAMIGHALSDLMNNGALKGLTEDLKPGQMSLTDSLKLFKDVPSFHSANLVLNTPAGRSLNPTPNIVQRLMKAGQTRNGEKGPDYGEDLLNSVGAKTIDRQESINTPNARAMYIKRQDEDTRKELVNLQNPFKNKQYTPAEIESRRRDLMDEIKKRNETISK